MGNWDRPAMGIKESTYCTVHWVLYTNNESWNIASKTKDILYGEREELLNGMRPEILILDISGFFISQTDQKKLWNLRFHAGTGMNSRTAWLWKEGEGRK